MDTGIILGSGLGDFAELVESPIVIKYKDLPNFPVSTVAGHAGRMVMGKIRDTMVMVMQGRFHFYEGYTLEEVTFPIRVMSLLGIKKLLLTNAAGGINTSFVP
ncbi:MAG TPA: purine-nucleoside phosphorylase, partial [Clostridiaceae bacterium]|nr:purine-nucleoside phosphorylase [Clostridiaceae bacterium]